MQDVLVSCTASNRGNSPLFSNSPLCAAGSLMGLLRPRNFNPRVRDYALAVTPQHAVLVLARPHNMVFTQRRGFVLGAFFGLSLIHI